MNYLVFLDAQAGELEKILSGVKRMVVKDFDPTHLPAYPVRAGDCLYFLRDNAECELRVKARVVSVRFLVEDLPHALKELQARLQLTEAQYNDLATRQQLMLVEFDSAQKIGVIQVRADVIKDRNDWMTFEEPDDGQPKYPGD